MRASSPPGSMTTASLVSAHASTGQLHSNGPAGNVSRSSTVALWPIGDRDAIERVTARLGCRQVTRAVVVRAEIFAHDEPERCEKRCHRFGVETERPRLAE